VLFCVERICEWSGRVKAALAPAFACILVSVAQHQVFNTSAPRNSGISVPAPTTLLPIPCKVSTIPCSRTWDFFSTIPKDIGDLSSRNLDHDTLLVRKPPGRPSWKLRTRVDRWDESPCSRRPTKQPHGRHLRPYFDVQHAILPSYLRICRLQETFPWLHTILIHECEVSAVTNLLAFIATGQRFNTYGILFISPNGSCHRDHRDLS
jgi:hypothetical protein